MKGRKLSDLSYNIKCGNSLIDDPKIAGEKAFDWNTEFKEIMGKGGFDVVIGNPPYVLCQPSNTKKEILDYYKTYDVASYKIDLFHLFYEKSLQILKKNGKLGFITPNTFMTNKYIQSLRTFILNNYQIKNIVLFDNGVFNDASVDVSTIILQKGKSVSEKIAISKMNNLGKVFAINTKRQTDWLNNKSHIFNIKDEFYFNSKNCVALKNIANTYFGIQPYDRKSSISKNKSTVNHKEIIDGADIFPFSLLFLINILITKKLT